MSDYNYDFIEFSKSILLVITALVPIINPPGGAPIFLAMTDGCSEQERRTMSKRIALNGFVMLLGSMFIGTYVLKFFGLSLPVVRVAGGLVVAAAGWRLLDADDHSLDQSQAPTPGPVVIRRTFYPLTFPLTIGPGSISVAITLGATLRTRGGIDALNLAGGVIGVLVVSLILFLSYRFAGKLITLLGETGTSVFLRLSAFILLCIGVQICWNGAAELIHSVIDSV
ncbi:MAG: NAAT family transporter [Burkholderiales bacterium]|nr:NAAT family transporter [Burkholderiales bacterium]